MSRSPEVGRRSIILRGGALTAGVLGAGALATASAGPAAAATGAFTPITPFRCYDSRRDTFGKLVYNDTVDVQANTDIYRATKFPTTATAVTFNLTVTETVSKGYLAIYPGSTTQMSSLSTLNWVGPGVDLANGGVIALGTSQYSGPASVAVYCGGFTNCATHLILDITGYYS